MASESASQDFSATDKCKSRARGPNFQRPEVLKLEELVRQNFETINSKLTNTITNKKKAEVWDFIATEVSSLGLSKRSKEECLTKWSNLKRSAKDAVTAQKLNRRKTGGGSCSTVTDQQTRVVDLYRDSSSFSGIIGGIDSDESDGLHYISNASGVMEEPATTKTLPARQQVLTSGATEAQTEPVCLPPMALNDAPAKESRSLKPSTRGIKRSRSETLMDYQIQYFKGQVERQSLETELLQVKLRMLKKAEQKLDEIRAADLLRLISEE